MHTNPLAPVMLALVWVAFALAGCAQDNVETLHSDAHVAAELRAELQACREQHRLQVSSTEVDALRAELRGYAELAEGDARRRAAMRRAMDDYARGVCLVHGVFTFYEVRDDEERRVTELDGRPFSLEYLGSGFLVSESGHVATNRHVAVPWWNNPVVEPLLRRGLQPRFVTLTVTFPGRESIPVDPATIRVSDDGVDLAVLRVPIRGVPVLPLSMGDPSELRGQRLMLLGYPTGLAALIARAEPEVGSAAMAVMNDTAALIELLSRRRALSPVSTHGTLNHVNDHKLVYDAVTTSGGSGGPVFGPDGDVVGVSYAMLREFQGSNFGVPIRFVASMIR